MSDRKPIEEMTEDELWKFCHGHICETGGCYRQCEHGNRFCIQCIHGTSGRASDDYVAAKKRLQKLVAKSFRARA